KTAPGCIWPDLPSACSTAFQSGSEADAIAGVLTITTRPRTTIAGFNLPNLMVKISLFTSRTPSGAGHFPSVDGTYQRTSPRRRPVHVQGEDRRAAAEAVGVIGGPLAHEPPTAGRVQSRTQPEPPPICRPAPCLIRPE